MSSVMIGISADADADRTLLDDQPVCAQCHQSDAAYAIL